MSSESRPVTATFDPRGPLVIELPLLPKFCWPNSRTRKSQLRDLAKRQAKKYAFLMATHTLNVNRRWLPFAVHEVPHVHVEIHQPRLACDPDNLIAALKSTFDGFTEAGVWVDDEFLHFYPPTILPRSVWELCPDRSRRKTGIWITLTREEG